MKWLLRPKVVVVFAVLFFALVCAFPYLYYGYSSQDAVNWAATMGQHETIYGERYSELKFARIRLGMTPDEVTALVGPPLEQARWNGNTNATIWWRYSRCDSKSGHYHLRGLEFSGHGAVVKIYRTFYFD